MFNYFLQFSGAINDFKSTNISCSLLIKTKLICIYNNYKRIRNYFVVLVNTAVTLHDFIA